MSELSIVHARLEDCQEVALLFHHYRLFYQIASRLEDCQSFISARLKNQDSTIFLARDAEGSAVGFVQLYPLFSETSLRMIWLLNDLYVKVAARNQGVARRLMQRASDFAKEQGGSGLTLSTAKDNHAAQRLYESLGYQKDERFLVYNLSL